MKLFIVKKNNIPGSFFLYLPLKPSGFSGAKVQFRFEALEAWIATF